MRPNLRLPPLWFLLPLLLPVMVYAHTAATNPAAGCPAGSWLDPALRVARERALRIYIETERGRLSKSTVGATDSEVVAPHECFEDSTRIYGYEHPAWPKPRAHVPHHQQRQHKKGGNGAVLPQINVQYDRKNNKTIYLHVLWKAGATSIRHGFHSPRLMQHHEAPPSGLSTDHAILFARDPVRRFASAISEVYYRARYQNNLVRHNPPRWWQHVRRRFPKTGVNITRLIEGMLLDIEHPRGCMGTANALHHLRSAGMFYSQARYPNRWLRSWRPQYQQLCVVGELPSQPSSHQDTTIAQLVQEYGDPAAITAPKNRRDTSVKPSDVPHTHQILSELYRYPDTLLRRVCRVYAADFICFGWTPPDACADMFVAAAEPVSGSHPGGELLGQRGTEQHEGL